MSKDLTEDEIRDNANTILDFQRYAEDGTKFGVGQLTTFNQLGFRGIADKPDGWFLPENRQKVAILIETKASKIELEQKQVDEVLKNIKIANQKYDQVVGVLYNGEDTRVFKNLNEYDGAGSEELQPVSFYLNLFNQNVINKEHIYEITARINNLLHTEFGIKNLYHRMIFTACALVAKRYDGFMHAGMDYNTFTSSILSAINKALIRDKKQNQKLDLLVEVFGDIKMNLNVNSEDQKEQDHVKELIAEFIGWINDISSSINSDAWRGEDVMGIFFNEFNRYKKKSESGQVFTPEHITDFMYRILEVNSDDYVLDAACGSGGFLVKAMANMVYEAGGPHTNKAKEIKAEHLFGIEYDREIFALACANMLIHKDGKTNLVQMDSREESAGDWISNKKITKVLMNPPFESKYGCVPIIKNVMDHVPAHTMCGFILPDKKLEKTGKNLVGKILRKHRLKKIIKLPEDLFTQGVTTSIFIFEAGVPQNDKEIFGCYMKQDGLQTVKNKGRHDIHDKWPSIENYWIDIIEKQSGDDTCQWIKPDEHLSYQMPIKPFEIFEDDFRNVAFNYFMFEKENDVSNFKNLLLDSVLYASDISEDDNEIIIRIPK